MNKKRQARAEPLYIVLAEHDHGIWVVELFESLSDAKDYKDALYREEQRLAEVWQREYLHDDFFERLNDPKFLERFVNRYDVEGSYYTRTGSLLEAFYFERRLGKHGRPTTYFVQALPVGVHGRGQALKLKFLKTIRAEADARNTALGVTDDIPF